MSVTFETPSSLYNHLRYHTGEKSFKCKTWSKQFKKTAAIKAHLQTQTKEKSFKYEIYWK